jgi:uncharacterized protein YceK
VPRLRFPGSLFFVNRKFLALLFAGLVIATTGCSSIRVKVSGDPGVRYQAAWTTADAGTTTRSGVVPASFTFDGDVLGWFQNATGNGEFRVRVFEGMGLLVDETFENSAQRVVIERKGRTVSFRID